MIVLDLGEKFNDVLFVSRNTASLVERSTVNTKDILVFIAREKADGQYADRL